MTKLTEAVVFTADNKPVLVMGESGYHSREGNALHRWINDCVPGASSSILCYASELEYEITSGKRLFITQMDVALESASDNAQFNLVGLDNTVGWKDVAGHVHIYSPGTLTGTEQRTIRYDPAIKLSYADGYRNAGVRVNANDGTAIVSAAWHGWVESEA